MISISTIKLQIPYFTLNTITMRCGYLKLALYPAVQFARAKQTCQHFTKFAYRASPVLVIRTTSSFYRKISVALLAVFVALCFSKDFRLSPKITPWLAREPFGSDRTSSLENSYVLGKINKQKGWGELYALYL